ncbi:SWIM zinc finger family protein [Nonomuraea sp. SYSU D8015]|uniref:SWIM zinc finger family protein n=1 Tax=Nonomuraea sp. SYSU D8015 TaxID=2593644 RepID=UPI003FA54FBF
MIDRWSRDQVLALAPDASSQKAAQGVAAPGKWTSRGATGTVVYGECKGSGAKPYLACVDLTEPAYRCSCPSRKFPCKHALGLLLMWSADEVPEVEAMPQWAAEWQESRAERAAKAAARLEAARLEAAVAKAAEEDSDPMRPGSEGAADAEAAPAAAGFGQVGSEPSGPGQVVAGRSGGAGVGPGGRAAVAGAGPAGAALGGGPGAESVRHARVAAGLAELERWLADQVHQGLAGAAGDDWDGLAKRLIDAQAPGVASMVSRLARVRAEDDWPGRLLEEYALINLLAVAYRRRADLPAPLAQTVLIRAGFPVTREQVLAGPVVRDQWDVLGRRDEQQDRLTARRVWLRGRRTGRPALILSFAPQGQPLDASLVTGTTIDAELTFYPGAAPLRALVATRHGTVPASELLTEHATVPATEPAPGHGNTPATGHEAPAGADRATGHEAALGAEVVDDHGPIRAAAFGVGPAPRPAARQGGASEPEPAAGAADAPEAVHAARPASSLRAAPPHTAPTPPAVVPSAVVPRAATPSPHTAPPAVPSVATSPPAAEPFPASPPPAVPRSAGGGRVGPATVPPGMSPEEALDEVARALAEDPWTESWPLVLTGVVPERRSLGGLPLHPRSRDPWRLIAVSGGRPLTVAAEWTPQGVRPLTTWDDEGAAVIL